MILCMSGAAAVLSGALLPPDLLVTWSWSTEPWAAPKGQVPDLVHL